MKPTKKMMQRKVLNIAHNIAQVHINRIDREYLLLGKYSVEIYPTNLNVPCFITKLTLENSMVRLIRKTHKITFFKKETLKKHYSKTIPFKELSKRQLKSILLHYRFRWKMEDLVSNG